MEKFVRFHLIVEIFILFVISLIPLLWFSPGHKVVGLDSGYPIDYVRYFKQRNYTWLSSQNFGVDMSAEAGIVPFNAFQAIVSMAGVGTYSVQKVTFVFWFFAISFAMYLFALYLFPKPHQWIFRFSAVF